MMTCCLLRKSDGSRVPWSLASFSVSVGSFHWKLPCDGIRCLELPKLSCKQITSIGVANNNQYSTVIDEAAALVNLKSFVFV